MTLRQLLIRAAMFALAAFVPLGIADAIWGIGFDPTDLKHRVAGMQWPYHCGALVLSTLGAWIGFHSIGEQGPSMFIATALGLLFGLVSIVGAPAAFMIGDAEGCVSWMFIGALFASAGASPFVKKVQSGPR